ncbi:MAG: hypothetical protein H6572_02245 [Lewinellaceae bacterium]|nr:hypothetical protein [Lewinellaceae bacterium]
MLLPHHWGGSITELAFPDQCGQSDNCSATFTVGTADELIAICPADGSIEACNTQAEVDAAFSGWLALIIGCTGGCNIGPLLSIMVGSGAPSYCQRYCPVLAKISYYSPNYCGGSITVNYSVSDQCGQSDNCSATFTVGSADVKLLSPG